MTVTCYAFNWFHREKRHSSRYSMYAYLIFLLVVSVFVDAAPHKSKNKKYDGPQLVYDQKQSGDYNIQVHLKDFQIIAMLGDDVLGDYDYNYDYADFTIKPSGSTSTTSKPTTITPSPPSPPSTTQSAPSSTSQKPLSTSSESILIPSDLMIPEPSKSPEKPLSVVVSNAHPYPIEVVEPQPIKKPEEILQSLRRKITRVEGTTEEIQGSPAAQDITTQDLTLETTLNLISNPKPAVLPQSSSSPIAAAHFSPTSSTPSSPAVSSPTPESSPPGKIKVQILGIPTSTGLSTPSSGGIVPGEGVQGGTIQEEANGDILHSELASYRRCSSGYARDKRGRCRRVRRPGLSSQLPFGFGRLASNLATRLRLTPPENPAATSISTEK